MRLTAEAAQPSTEETILTAEAVDFLCSLQRRFASRRQELLTERDQRQAEFDLGHIPDPLPEMGRRGEIGQAHQTASVRWLRAGDARRSAGG